MINIASNLTDLIGSALFLELSNFSRKNGISLTLVTAAKGYQFILTIPETMRMGWRYMLKALGSRLLLTEGA